MKHLSIILMVLLIVMSSVITTSAEEAEEKQLGTEGLYEAFEADKLYDSLSKDTKKLLEDIGVGKPTEEVISNVSFRGVLSGILKTATKLSPAVFSNMAVILGVMIISSITDGIGGSMTHKTLKDVSSMITALCVSATVSLSVCDIIGEANTVIRTASDFMLSYIPIMLAVMISCGNSLTGSGYYALMNTAAQVVSQLSSRLVVPMLNVFLGLNLCNSIQDSFKISGLLKMFSKTVMWILGFSFTLFSALLTFRSLISSSVDNVSSRAVRYTMQSFIPVVGGALSEAYRTVRGSVVILKNGMGVFVILSVFVIFLPIMIKLLLWMFSLNLCKTFGEMLNLKQPCELLSGISMVLSTLFAVIICIMALFIVSTALIMTMGRSTVY